jgi:hypothetical protein
MKLGRPYLFFLIAAIGFLCFLAGFITTTVQVFPYPLLRDAFLGFHSVDTTASLADSDMYVPAGSERGGVSENDVGQTYKGYTLFASADGPRAYLIDMAGRIVHEWSLPYSKIWNRGAAVKDPVADKFIFWRHVALFPNGDLLAVYESWADHPYGYGLVKIDSNSRPIWSFLERVHHDVEVAPDGRLYALSHRNTDQVEPGLPVLAPTHYEDFVNVLSPDGVLLRQVSMLKAFANSPFKRMIGLKRNSFDPLHTNEVTPVSAVWARRLAPSGADVVLVSLRNLDSLALVDLDSSKVTWVMRGPFAHQHCSDVLPDGNITVFDNMGDMAHGGGSRVLEFQPSPFRLLWEFPGNSGASLDSLVLGCAQRLPNGNTLITEGEGARLLEVTPADRVVWQYRSPFRLGNKNQFIPVIFSGFRYAPDHLHFAFNRATGVDRQIASKELPSR